MRRDELPELHYITHIENLPSILRRGILSHRRADGVQHISVAMEEIQERRAKVVVPGGRPLHQYANLYVNARNKMMYKRRCSDGCDHLGVLRVSTDVLNLSGVIIADKNASSASTAWIGNQHIHLAWVVSGFIAMAWVEAKHSGFNFPGGSDSNWTSC